MSWSAKTLTEGLKNSLKDTKVGRFVAGAKKVTGNIGEAIGTGIGTIRQFDLKSEGQKNREALRQVLTPRGRQRFQDRLPVGSITNETSGGI